jgi:hypothetical protein
MIRRLGGTSGLASDIIANFTGNTPAIVTIAPTDVGSSSSRRDLSKQASRIN